MSSKVQARVVRPKAIKSFGKWYLAGAVLSVLNTLVNYGALREYSLVRGGAAATSLMASLSGLLVSFLLWFLIVRRANNLAKWVVVVLTGLSLLGMIPPQEGAYDGLTPFYLASSAAVTVVNLIAISFLFRQDAIRWLRSRGTEGEIDPRVFD